MKTAKKKKKERKEKRNRKGEKVGCFFAALSKFLKWTEEVPRNIED